MHSEATELLHRQLDISEPAVVQVEIDYDRRVVYVHVDGLTALRICRADTIQLKTKGRKAGL